MSDGGFEFLTNLAVRCPLPNPLPRGEGIRFLKIRGCRIGNRMAGKPKNVQARQPNSLSPWERARERASKPQACLFSERYESVIRTRFGF